MTKKITYRIALLLVGLVAMNFIYKQFFFEPDLQKHSDIINLPRKIYQEQDEIVYIGESSNFTVHPSDLDSRKISQMIADYFPGIKMGDITKEACHAGIYYELLRNIPDNSNVKTVIVTMNLRSFNADWIYSKLETPMQKSIVLLKNRPPLFNRLMLTFKGYGIKTDEECMEQKMKAWEHDPLSFPYPFEYANTRDWDKGKASNDFIKNPDGSKNYELTELACHYIKSYAFKIDVAKNPRIKDFDRLVKMAKDRNWNLIFNLMAENTDKADSLIGDDLLYLMNYNRDLLIDRYNRNGVIVVDNLEQVRDKYFIDQNWTTEHYSEMGRKIIAKNVALALKAFYPEQFTQVEFSTSAKAFFNDCEDREKWGQTQTLTTEKAYSGNYSSKVGDNEKYGTTFEKPVLQLPDSIQKIRISMQIFKDEQAEDAKVVFEVIGKQKTNQWIGIPISEQISQTNEWAKFEYEMPPIKDFYLFDRIKIYLYNPSKGTIYVDDIDIRFE